MTEQSRRNSFILVSVMVVVVVALLPWWHNHSYLRDTYDYGLVLAANGHMDRGERPYVDFTTPIQAGFLGLNWAIERAGGGTYFALTLGGAGLIALTAGLLCLMLTRRWPLWAALLVGGVVAVCGASQHTILWHNALGVFCLALVTWAAACAPVLRRADRAWHALLFAGLFLGGLNKLNFHLIAIAVTLAWAVRAGLLRQAGWGRVGGTVLAILLAGAVLPVAAEMAWTGASLSLWLANVVQLASTSRLEILRKIGSADFLLQPIHDYYGPLPLPQIGLAGLWLSVATLAGCWPGRGAAGGPARWDRWLAPVAVGLAGAAGAALLATNFEIGSLGLGAWLVLLVSVWLGFAPAGRRAVFAGGFLLPVLVIGLAAWWSAWQGQRSQFGFSDAPRAKYLPAESASPAFARLAGLRLPPDFMASLEGVESSLPAPEADGRRPVFYGQGLEFLDRFFPSQREVRQPLWVHWDTTYSSANLARLAKKIGPGDVYRTVLLTAAFDDWPAVIFEPLSQNYAKGLVGPRIRRWSRVDRNNLNLADNFDTLSRLGGNVASQVFLIGTYPLRSWRLADGKIALGIIRESGCVLLGTPVYRFRGIAVVERLPDAGDGALFADFRASVHGSIPEQTRWSARVELPAGQRSVSVPFEVEANAERLLLWVSQPSVASEVLFAGFREIEIINAVESAGAPQLQPPGQAEVAATPELAASLFGDIAWRPHQLTVRGGRAGAAGLELSPGGEIWLHTDNMTGEIRGQVVPVGQPGAPAFMRVVWYKGGRLQLMQHGWVQPGQPVDFHVWTAEPGGWIGILSLQADGTAPMSVRVNTSSLTP